MKILILSYYFPPFNTIGAVRVGKFAKYLSRFGNDVRVVAADEPVWESPVSRGLALEIPESKVNYTSWHNPRLLLERISIGKITKPEADGPGAGEGKGRAVLRNLRSHLNPSPYGTLGWVPYAVAAGVGNRAQWRPDVVLASALPPTALIAARIIAGRLRVPWVADLRDLWADNHYHDHSELRRQLERRFEKQVLGTASAIITVSEPLADSLRARHDQPVHVITNGFDNEDYQELENFEPPPEMRRPGIINVVYLGRLYLGKRDPSPLLRALKLLGSDARRFHVSFFGADSSSVISLASDLGVLSHVTVHDSVPYRESIALQKAADLLLLLLWDRPEEKGVLTGKLFEYIGAAKPILCIGPRDTAAAALIRTNRLGAVSNESAEIAEYLRSLLADGPESATVNVNSNDFSRESRTRDLERLLMDVSKAGYGGYGRS